MPTPWSSKPLILTATPRLRARSGISRRGRPGELARECNVRCLFLTHISRRYREFEVIREARRFFPQSYVARDLDHFAIYRDRPPQKLETQPVKDELLPGVD